MGANPRRLHALFWASLAVYLVWGALYVLRTSFVWGGGRVFLLWDDAMVSMSYARSLVEGHGLVWYPGADRVQGYSNLGVTLLMAAIHLLPLSPTKISLAFQIVNLGLLAYVAILVRDVTASLAGSPVPGRAAGMLAMGCAPLAILGLQGTDVVVVVVVLLAALRLVVTRAQDGGAWPDRVYLLLALGVLVRLDFAPLFLVFGAASLLFPRSRMSLVRAAAAFAITLGGIVAFQRAYYGDPLPNTYYLKATGTPVRLMLWSGFNQQLNLHMRAAVPLALAVVAFWALRRRDRRLWLLGALYATVVAYDLRSGGDWVSQYTSRFCAPALPLLIIGVVAGLWHLAERVTLGEAGEHEGHPRTPARLGGTPNPPGPSDIPAAVELTSRRRFAAFAFLSLATLPVVNTVTAFEEWVDPRRETMLKQFNIDNFRLAQYLRAHSRPGATVGVHSAGTIPYFLDRHTIDVLGKCDAHIARMKVPRFRPGHSKWDWDYIMRERRPDVLDHATRGLDERKDFLAQYGRVVVDGVEFVLRRESRDEIDDPAVRIDPITPRSSAAKAATAPAVLAPTPEG
jgi:hypothetical protein